jgi:hypothetical protein
MTTVYFNRKSGECFVAADSRSCRFLEAELFDSGRRNREDFETATTSGFVQIHDLHTLGPTLSLKPRLNVTTFDDPSCL